MNRPRILALAGSARQKSFNKQLIAVAAAAAERAGASVTRIDLKDFPLPLFDEDLEREQGPPAKLAELKQLFFDHQGLLIASPEYNSSLTGLLKNTIDWLSRRAEGEASLQAFRGKVVGIMAASPGALGGLRGMVHLRAILSNIGAVVVPEQAAVPNAFQAFKGEGRLVDEELQQRVDAVGQRVAGMLLKLYA